MLIDHLVIILVEKLSEEATRENKLQCVKEPKRIPVLFREPIHRKKFMDIEEDNITGPLLSDKTTQFPSVHAELLSEPKKTTEAVCGMLKPSTSKVTTTLPASASSISCLTTVCLGPS